MKGIEFAAVNDLDIPKMDIVSDIRRAMKGVTRCGFISVDQLISHIKRLHIYKEITYKVLAAIPALEQSQRRRNYMRSKKSSTAILPPRHPLHIYPRLVNFQQAPASPVYPVVSNSQS